MPFQHSPPAKHTRSPARTQSVFTPTPRVPLDGTPAVPQLRAHFDRTGLSRTTFKGPGEEEGENAVEEEESDGTEGVPAPVGVSQGTGRRTSAQSSQPVSNQSEPYLLTIMQTLTQIMANLQESIYEGTQPFKIRSFIQSCQLIFHDGLENLSQERKKFLHDTSFLIFRAEKWI
ncbi:hypothetical protein O181_043483 [Austropuccinia psidii MF-1]|uniref:Uncharacterized protein n=1 Tax=Austropuccinia psidii MF-1 TaxID=1389203 RepID=A0A9Q3HFQ5_9BASI|nr:hypothetical protein [Austropuccinia psidii MF-1]